jgi:hypothetical protein
MYERYYTCHSCLNRRVKVHTVYGGVHEGVIVSVDQNNVYRKPDSALKGNRVFFIKDYLNKEWND